MSAAEWAVVAVAALVLALPGWALSGALFPRHTIARGERLVYSLALAVAVAALGGLMFVAAFGPGRGTWLALAVTATLAGLAIARRRALPRSRRRQSRRRRPAGVSWVLALLAATAVAGAAIAIASEGVREQQGRQRFASLWAVPAQKGGPVEVGVWNHGGPARYRLRLSGDGKQLGSWQLDLLPGQRWRLRLGRRASAARPLKIVLYHRGEPYRRVELAAEVSR